MGKLGARNDTDAYMVDRGCRVHPACLTCPLERCIFDDPLITERTLPRSSRVAELAAAGKNAKEIALELNLHLHYVHALVRGTRKAAGGA